MKRTAKLNAARDEAQRPTRILEGRVALVTGASRGIGRAVALRLALEGAAVAVNYRTRAKEAASVVADIRSANGVAEAIRADVSKPKDVQAMVALIKADLGPPDILVNNAAVMYPADLDSFDSAQMERMRATNVDGVINVTRAIVDGMKDRGFGRIVNVTSIAGTGTAFPGTTFYAATKAAVALLTRRFALELGPFGITVNAVAPGFIMTDMNTGGRTQSEIEATSESVVARTMMRRVGMPEDIAAGVAFLVSPAAGFVTAQVLTIDGGRIDYIGHG
jgi:3-oxoacyl-[acyl-carrier protein] reductase